MSEDMIAPPKGSSEKFGGFERVEDGLYALEADRIEFTDTNKEGNKFGDGIWMFTAYMKTTESETNPECVGLNHVERFYVDPQYEWMAVKAIRFLQFLGALPSDKNLPKTVFTRDDIRNAVEKKSPGLKMGAEIVRKPMKDDPDKTRAEIQEMMFYQEFRSRTNGTSVTAEPLTTTTEADDPFGDF